MKRIDENNEQHSQMDSVRNPFIGLVFILAGGVWLLYNFDVISANILDFIFSWEVLIMLIGAFLLYQRRWIGGGITLFVGLFFLVINLCNIDLPINKLLIPVTLIAIGAGILLTKLKLKKN